LKPTPDAVPVNTTSPGCKGDAEVDEVEQFVDTEDHAPCVVEPSHVTVHAHRDSISGSNEHSPYLLNGPAQSDTDASSHRR